MASSRGLGHDESAGFFVDGGGNDRYTVARLSNGSTSNVGYGFFVDAGGDDTYATIDLREPGRYGQAVIDGDFANYRGYEGARALGLFLDMAGDDHYQDPPAQVANGSSWKRPGAASYRLARGGRTPTRAARGGTGHHLETLAVFAHALPLVRAERSDDRRRPVRSYRARRRSHPLGGRRGG